MYNKMENRSVSLPDFMGSYTLLSSSNLKLLNVNIWKNPRLNDYAMH